MNEFNSLEREAGLLTIQGMQTSTIHVALFAQMLAAQQAGNEKLANFYAQRFPPDLRKAYEAWLAEKPLENPNAPPHPFVAPLYKTPGTREAAEVTSKAAIKIEESRNAGSVSGQYLANTVLLAMVLFFANASLKFEQQRVRVVTSVFALVIFAYAVVRATMLPR